MNKLVKISLVIISVLAPMKGFCFPDIPENYWMENTIPGFWDEPQYTTGYNCLRPTTDPVTYGVSGNSMEHTIIISRLVDPYHKHALCQIWNKGGSMETTADIERYPYRYNNNYPYKCINEIIFCNFPNKGRLIVGISLNHKGKILSSRCCWQTLEMMEDQKETTNSEVNINLSSNKNPYLSNNYNKILEAVNK